MSACVGIDPGVTGAIAALDGEGGAMLWDLQSKPAQGATRIRNVLDLAAVHLALQAAVAVVGEGATAWIEDVRAFGVGVNAVQTLVLQCLTLGQVEGLCVAVGLVPVRVHSQDWQRPFGTKGDKGQARRVAASLYPDLAHLFERVKDDDRADATLIAHFGLHYGPAFLNRRKADR